MRVQVGGLSMEKRHLSNEKYEVCFNETVGYVTMRFKTHIKGDEYREALLKGKDCLVTKAYTKWLAASTSLVVINSEEQQWIMKEWIPAAHKAGLNYFAVVLPLSNKGRSMIESMGLSISNEFFTYKLFEDEDSAIQWLAELPSS
jgi:hypothetical protein